MKNRVWWFLGFYILLSLFIIYQLVYVGIIWSNGAIFDLYYHGFSVAEGSRSSFDQSSFFEIFDLPVVGIFLSIAGIITSIVSQSVILRNSTAQRKGFFLVISFVIFLIGFYMSFVGQLFYNEWNDSTVKIIPKETGTIVPAINYYQHWLSLTMLWTIFGVFFGLVITAIILIIKLYFLNIQWARYIKKNEDDDYMELELTAPLPNNGRFNPNETQTITITLDKETFERDYEFKVKKKTGAFIIKNKENKSKKINKIKKR